MKDDLRTLAIVLSFFVGAFAVLVFIANAIGAYTCENYERVAGIETRWVTLDECYVRTSAGWQRWDEYIARSVTNEGTK